MKKTEFNSKNVKSRWSEPLLTMSMVLSETKSEYRGNEFYICTKSRAAEILRTMFQSSDDLLNYVRKYENGIMEEIEENFKSNENDSNKLYFNKLSFFVAGCNPTNLISQVVDYDSTEIIICENGFFDITVSYYISREELLQRLETKTDDELRILFRILDRCANATDCYMTGDELGDGYVSGELYYGTYVDGKLEFEPFTGVWDEDGETGQYVTDDKFLPYIVHQFEEKTNR